MKISYDHVKVVKLRTRKVRTGRVLGVAEQGITIHNMKADKPYREWDVKCDRSSPLGSPFYLMGDESKRDWVCDSYASWFKKEVLSQNNWTAYQELMRLKALYKKHGKLRIFCWCAPLRCHTETIKAWLEANA